MASNETPKGPYTDFLKASWQAVMDRARLAEASANGPFSQVMTALLGGRPSATKEGSIAPLLETLEKEYGDPK